MVVLMSKITMLVHFSFSILEYVLQHVEVATSSNAAAAAAFSHYNNRKTSKHFMTALTFQYEAKSLHRSFIVTWR